MNISVEKLLADFLSAVERTESTLLTWGVVDGFSTEQELVDRAEGHISNHDAWHIYPDGVALLNDMADRGLLFRWHESGEMRYRSRLGEALRLLARLRQLFPKHLRDPGAWLSSSTLVADFRLLLRPRKYPDRNQPAEGAIAEWMTLNSPRLTALQEDVLGVLLGSTDGATGLPLAGFQTRATRRILSMGAAQTASGSVVCAGTGSGKTLAFYLPAMTLLAGMIERDAEHWVRALALYPRNELLKDQFTETCRMTRKVNRVLLSQKRRALRIGALFGSAPRNAGQVADPDWDKWPTTTGGFVCPFLQCPDESCAGQMVWRDEDRLAERERLTCGVCQTEVNDNEIVLTRQRLAKEPPDILFTTTEMLNRRMTDSRSWRLFGIGGPATQKPVLMLLDEAHTYEGLHGAQVAYLLRRWRHRSGCTPHFVGLSATLMEATSFFAQLTGLPVHAVEEVSPEPAEMLEGGMEYLVAVRGDPVSGTSLLSTTIQTAMLLRRVLDADRGADSRGAYGKKIFIFTDDLDVTNRLYFNLLDAEGMNVRGLPDRQRHPDGSLAALRASTRQESHTRFLHGQSWELCETLGHSLRGDSYVRLGRVSSQDAGVDSTADVIVATAALEVGFNDPEVGAVLQHKAPHQASTFLQRKGRAGRGRDMRPWTVVVLSDYGRDRLAYQGYDLLFDPELRPRDLPLANRHVLKMQATYAFLDWIASQLPLKPGGQFWEDASGPWSALSPGFWRDNVMHRHTTAATIVADVLAGGDGLQQFQNWLRTALRLASAEDVDPLLWEAPRALMTAALPTLLRRLETQWLSGDKKGAEHRIPHQPLPEFIPASLFSDLNLPEVTIWAVIRPGQDPKAFPLPAAQALREFAPGRISRRFGIWHKLTRHWLPIAVDGTPTQEVDVDAFCGQHDREFLGDFAYRDDEGKIVAVPVVRPFALHVRNDAPFEVADSSNARLQWKTQLLPPPGSDAGLVADLPARSPWRGVIEEIRFFTHRQHQPARVRRFALGSHAGLRTSDGNELAVASQFVLDEGAARRPAALGFAFEADALRVRLRFPTDWKLNGADASATKLHGLRAAYFRWRITTDDRLSDVANIFQREWIAEIVLAGTTATAVEAEQSLEEAWNELNSNQSSGALSSVLDVIFQSIAASTNTDTDANTRLEQRRQTELRALLNDATVAPVLNELAPFLWLEPDDSWTDWLRQKFLVTFGAAFRDAIQQLCPDVDSDDLVVDLDAGPSDQSQVGSETPDGCADLWVSETAPGGGGVIERLLPRLAEDPRRFLDLAQRALAESDFETSDRELTRFLQWMTDSAESEFSTLVASVRAPESQASLSATFQDLRAALKARGLQTSHTVLSALSARLLRPGSTNETDILMRDTLDRWTNEESRLGVEIEARALAYSLSASDALDDALGDTVPLGPGQDRRQWRFNALYGLLWPRGAQARNHALALYNPYAELVSPERLLVMDALSIEELEVQFDAPDWQKQLEQTLVREGRVAFSSPSDTLAEFRESIVRLLATPVDTGTLLLYPRIRGVCLQSHRTMVTMELVTPGQVTAGAPESEGTPTGARLIVKTLQGSRDEVRDLLESLFAAELLAPSEEIWLVSPWVTDLPLLDNRAGAYAGLEPSWPKRFLTLAELLAFALKTSPSCQLRVVTRPDIHNRRFCQRLRTLAELDATDERLVMEEDRETLHTKGLAGTHFALKGSMNFTYNGIEVLEEAVELETDLSRVASLLLSFKTHYPKVTNP
ncbi:MAG: hypothetical protein ACI8UO_003230 [Verrucomicrobiales bacterium]|jgi:hypothetical protein